MKGLFRDEGIIRVDEDVEIVNKWLSKNEEALIAGSFNEGSKVGWDLKVQRLYDLEEEYIKLERKI